MGAKYPELFGTCDHEREYPPHFPAKCPGCGAAMVNHFGVSSDAYCNYVCGGEYRATRKQHAMSGLHVWTGKCPKGK